MRELRVELLMGRKVVDRNGKKAGRIEEIVAEYRDADLIVTEVHLGRIGFAERFSLRTMFGMKEKSRSKIRWSDLDLSDPDRPRLTLSLDEL